MITRGDVTRTGLPVVNESSAGTWRIRAVHALRVALVAALLWAIPSPRSSQSDGRLPPTIEHLRAFPHQVPGDWKLGDRSDQTDDSAIGLWQIVDAQGRVVGWVARTLPEAADVVGYRGPTEASIVLDPRFVIQSVALLGSDDTQEHVDAVVRDAPFFQQFRGWRWGELPRELRIDGVSGATLTSLALAEGVIKRMSGSRPSLVFAKELTADDVRAWFPDASSVNEATGQVLDSEQRVIGHVVRTGPFSDDRMGYQGPTELLIGLDTSGRIDKISIRQSFDNEPYVDYVRTESAFWKLFLGKTMNELAEFDPKAARVEGVSGATMTSQTVAQTLSEAAKGYVAKAALQDQPQPSNRARIPHWTTADVVTLVMLITLGVFSQCGWFRIRWIRKCWLVAVISIIGLWTGNLISLALIAGWSAEGIAWRLAPGLAAVVILALALPAVSKSNPYCNHLCPHGAIQQLIRPASESKRRLAIGPRWNRWLRRVPGSILVLAYLTVWAIPTIDLSSWEPFHAYLFRIAGWGSLCLAVFSLLVSATVPMAYCRWGCPTGRMIDYLRFSAVSGRLQFADLVALGLLILVLARTWLFV